MGPKVKKLKSVQTGRNTSQEDELPWLAEVHELPVTASQKMVISSITIDITQNCNFRCPHCIEAEAMINSGKKSLMARTVCKLIKQFAISGGTEVLIYGGEPTIHPDFGNILLYAAEIVPSIRIATNGSLLYKQEINRAICESAEYTDLQVRVSLNSGCEKTHAFLHGVHGVFENILKGMRLLKQRAGKIKLVVSYLVAEENANEIRRAYSIAESCKADRFEIRHMTNLHGINLVQFSEKAKSVVLRAIEWFSSQSKTGRTTQFFVEPLYEEFLRNGRSPDTTKPYSACWYCGRCRVVVTPPEPGVVWACPYWRGDHRFKIADLNKILFGSLQFEEQRRKVVNSINPNTYCTGVICNRHKANKFIWENLEMQQKYRRIITPSLKVACKQKVG